VRGLALRLDNSTASRHSRRTSGSDS
jgi:hypothetical protein